MRQVTGSVLILQCTKCGKTFPHFRFSGEGDTDTEGLGSLTDCQQNELVIAELDANEWNTADKGGAQAYAMRIRNQTQREELQLIRLIRIEESSIDGKGMSFQEFSKLYQPPKLFYSCPFCQNGESQVIDKLTIEQYRAQGGKITALGALVV